MDGKEFLEFLFYDDEGEDEEDAHPTFVDWWDEVVNEYGWEDEENGDSGDDSFVI